MPDPETDAMLREQIADGDAPTTSDYLKELQQQGEQQ